MTVPECRYRRLTTAPGKEQMHCVLKRDNCEEDDCKSCKYVENDSTPGSVTSKNKKAWAHRHKTSWTPSHPSRGVGDTVARVLNRTGVTGLYRKVAGDDCGGCEKRREFLNKKFPYKEKTL